MAYAKEEKKSVLEALQSLSSVITSAACNGSLCCYARMKQMKDASLLPALLSGFNLQEVHEAGSRAVVIP